MPLDGNEADFAQRTVDAVGAVLLRAAGIISERGLCKGSYGALGGPRCILGAIHEAKSASLTLEGAARIQEECKRIARASDWQIPLWPWNDREETTADDVCTILRKAAYL